MPPIDIKEDREVRLIWAKFQILLSVHNKSKPANCIEYSLDKWEQIRQELEDEMHTRIAIVRKRARLERLAKVKNNTQGDQNTNSHSEDK